MTDQAVIESIDTGADLNDTGSGGGTAATQPGQESLPADTGARAGDGGTQDQGTSNGTTGGTGADTQSQAGSGAQDTGKDKLVPLSALQEARAELRAVKQEIAELRAQPRLTPEEKERLAALQTTQSTAEKDPDFLEDPKGYIDAQVKKTQAALKKLDDSDKNRNTQEQQQRDTQQLIGTVSAKEQEFLKTTPDYNDALTHIRSVRASQLALMYPNATQQQIQQQIGIEEIQGARQILQNGGDPAAFAYAYAKTVGYSPKAPAAAGAGTQPAAKETKTVDKDAARSLGGGGTGASTAEETDDEAANTAPFMAALEERFGVRRKK